MSGEMPFGHEGGDHALFERRGSAMVELTGAREGLNRFFRDDEVAKPQTWIQHLAEAAGIELSFVAIDAFQSRQRPAQIAEFAVVIILDNECAGTRGPRQQRYTPRQR